MDSETLDSDQPVKMHWLAFQSKNVYRKSNFQVSDFKYFALQSCWRRFIASGNFLDCLKKYVMLNSLNNSAASLHNDVADLL